MRSETQHLDCRFDLPLLTLEQTVDAFAVRQGTKPVESLFLSHPCHFPMRL